MARLRDLVIPAEHLPSSRRLPTRAAHSLLSGPPAGNLVHYMGALALHLTAETDRTPAIAEHFMSMTLTKTLLASCGVRWCPKASSSPVSRINEAAEGIVPVVTKPAIANRPCQVHQRAVLTIRELCCRPPRAWRLSSSSASSVAPSTSAGWWAAKMVGGQ